MIPTKDSMIPMMARIMKSIETPGNMLTSTSHGMPSRGTPAALKINNYIVIIGYSTIRLYSKSCDVKSET